MSLTTNLVSYYKFDSSNSNDSVGSNNGTDTSITYSSGNGKINIGAGFASASTSRISFSTLFTTGSADFTLLAWIKTSTVATQVIFSVGNTTTNNGLFLYVHTDGKLHFDLVNSGGPSSASTTVNDGNFHLVAVTNTSGTVQLWIDGATNGSSVSMSPNITAGTCGIGRDMNSLNNYFNGAIDEVGIWSRALSSTEISQLYNSGAGFQYPFSTVNSGAFMQFF